MRSQLTAFCLLTAILTSSISADILGYDCGNDFISIDRLEDVKLMATYSALNSKGSSKLRERFSDSKHYSGPPFTKPHLLWPVAPDAVNYETVIKIIGQEVKECQVREWATAVDGRRDFGCGLTFFPDRELKAVIDVVCPMTREIARERFPARYTGRTKGRPFTPNGSQLYIFPLLKSKIYQPDDGMENSTP